MQDLQKLFLEQLGDVLHAEKQITRALPKMMKAAKSPELQDAFEEHLRETEQQIERLEEVFQSLGKSAKATKCPAMEGLVKEGDEIAKKFKGNSAIDAALIGAAQKVEHYEIASYGCLCTWAKELGLNDALPLLKETLAEEKQTDEKLSELAETHLNMEALQEEAPRSGSRMTKTTAGRSR